MASRSSKVIFAQSSRGNESIGLFTPGFIPQSMSILLSTVVKSMQDLPTCPNPPSVNNETSDFCESFIWEEK
jgi:hypothetical protein